MFVYRMERTNHSLDKKPGGRKLNSEYLIRGEKEEELNNSETNNLVFFIFILSKKLCYIVSCL